MDNPQEIDGMVFYCKDCEEIVETVRCGRKYVYKCKVCGTKNVAFGTEKSIKGFFRLDESAIESAPENAESTTVKDMEAQKKKEERRAKKT